jgi:hypothetical protein
MAKAISAPETFWNAGTAGQVRRWTAVADGETTERISSDSIDTLLNSISSGLVPLTPVVLIEMTHRAAARAGRSVWLEVNAGKEVAAGWVGAQIKVACCNATLVGVVLQQGHWSYYKVMRYGTCNHATDLQGVREWDALLVGLGGDMPVDVGEAVLASLPTEFYLPQAEQSPGYMTMFSGYGPVELMMDLAGWECDAYCEWEAHLAEFLHIKHPRAAYCKDAAWLAEHPMEWGIAEHRIPHVRLLIGGPPCQAMSKAGR